MDSSASLAHSFPKECLRRSSLPSYEPVSRSDYDPYEYQGHDYRYERQEYHAEDYLYGGREYHAEDYQLQEKPWTRRKAFWITITITVVATVLAVTLPVVLIVDKKHGVSAAQPTPSGQPGVSLLRPFTLFDLIFPRL
jgi:glucan 1,3-beta-glucosidase